MCHLSIRKRIAVLALLLFAVPLILVPLLPHDHAEDHLCSTCPICLARLLLIATVSLPWVLGVIFQFLERCESLHRPLSSVDYFTIQWPRGPPSS